MIFPERSADKAISRRVALRSTGRVETRNEGGLQYVSPVLEVLAQVQKRWGTGKRVTARGL